MIDNYDYLKSKINVDQSKLHSINNGYLLGVLASEEDKLPFIGEDEKPVTIMKNSFNVVTYIKLISEEPEFIKKELNPYIPCKDIYINVDIHSRGHGIYNTSYTLKSTDEKCEYNEKIFKDKIVVFKPQIRVNAGKIHKNVTLVKLIDANDMDIHATYLPVPIIKGTSEEFEENLFKEKRIIMNDGVKESSSNEYIICGNRFYGVFDDWYKSYGFNNGWMCKGKENVTSIAIDMNDEEFKKNCIVVNNEIAFLNKSYLAMLDSKLINEGTPIDFERFEGRSYEPTKSSLADESIQHKEATPLEDIEDRLIDLSVSTELDFLNKFKDLTLDKGLYYSFDDLINFHVSLKTSPLTILAGMTGTGKTQIAKCYAELLGLSHNEGNLLFLPINPSFTEPQDVLGYLNTNTGLYIPAETGLVDIIVKAVENEEDMFMVIFDEMNLSQIEYWFAPFLSLLELPQSERYLSLYGKGQVCHNAIKYPSSVKIPDNILFVGTVNLDDTVKDFSDRVLDRANIITLEKRRFIDSYCLELAQNSALYSDGINTNSKISSSLFYSWIRNSNGLKDFKEEEVLFLDSINELLFNEDNQKGISFRMIDKMSAYLKNIPESLDGTQLISRGDAFDLLIKQRLLTKLRGSERQLNGIIEAPYSSSNNQSPLYTLFESIEAKEISDFKLVKTAIKNKEKELSKYGYTN